MGDGISGFLETACNMVVELFIVIYQAQRELVYLAYSCCIFIDCCRVHVGGNVTPLISDINAKKITILGFREIFVPFIFNNKAANFLNNQAANFTKL